MVSYTLSNTSGNTWQIIDTSRRVWDTEVALTFEDNGVPIAAADISSTDYLFGTVTFTAAKTGPITVSGNYIPLVDIAGAKSYSLSMSADILDGTTIPGATANGGFRQKCYGLRDVSVSIPRWEELDDTFHDAWLAKNKVIIDIQPGGAGSIFRGWFAIEGEPSAGDVDQLEERTPTFQLAGDPAELEQFFSFST